jgi:rubrerythrin
MELDSRDRWDAGSSRQREALARLRGHAQGEAAMVDAYRRLIERAPDEVVEYLAQLIYDDERRHHELLADVLGRLEAQVRWEQDPSRLPRERRLPAPTAVRDELAHLLAAERADASGLRRLRHELHHLPGTALTTLIVELMELDTTKHVRILEFLCSSTTG